MPRPAPRVAPATSATLPRRGAVTGRFPRKRPRTATLWAMAASDPRGRAAVALRVGGRPRVLPPPVGRLGTARLEGDPAPGLGDVAVDGPARQLGRQARPGARRRGAGLVAPTAEGDQPRPRRPPRPAREGGPTARGRAAWS